MAISLHELARKVDQLTAQLESSLTQFRISFNQMLLASGLSELSENMGLLRSGEFRAGTVDEPGDGFSGVRIGWPGFSYDSETWHIAGVNNDTLQVGIRASDGKLYGGAGTVVIDATGVEVEVSTAASEEDLNAYRFVDSGGTTMGGYYAYLSGRYLRLRTSSAQAGTSVTTEMYTQNTSGTASSTARSIVTAQTSGTVTKFSGQSDVDGSGAIQGTFDSVAIIDMQQATNGDFSTVITGDFTVEDAANSNIVFVNEDNRRTTFSSFLNIEDSGELTISGGEITITGSYHSVDTQGDASTDDLDTINGGINDDILILTAADGARTVVCKDGANLKLAGDMSLDALSDKLWLIKRGGNWHELTRSNNA